MEKAMIDNVGMNSMRRYKALYLIRREPGTKIYATQEVFYSNGQPTNKEVWDVLVKKHGSGWQLGVTACFESAEN